MLHYISLETWYLKNADTCCWALQGVAHTSSAAVAIYFLFFFQVQVPFVLRF